MTRGPLEQETCDDVILPALAAVGWSDEQIRPQVRVKAQRVMSVGGVERALGDGAIDYVLEIVPGLPVAVLEAKRAHRAASDGVQQAIRYASQLDVPLAYASNGAEVIERDMVSGRERTVTSFPTPPEMWARYVEQHGLDDATGELLQRGFNRNKRSASGEIIQPRWYQTTAVHRVLCAMGRGERRLLLLMATGTGKTFTAMQIVHKLRAHARLVSPDDNYRVLYLADRDALLKQPKDKDFTVAFGSDPLWRVSGEVNRSREIYFASYQSLTGRGDEEDLFREYRPDFFDLVIVDECHRGSAAENSSWRRVLEHFAPAVQLGLTATPKQDDTVDTYRYFGEPLFTYSLRQGIEDGFLAPYRVRRVVLSADADGWEPEPGQVDRFGREIPEGRYTTRDFERVVRLLMRTDLAARYLSKHLRRDPAARTMVFCVDQAHAEDMRRALVAANPDLVAADPEWVVRIVGAEEEKVRLLEAFCDPESASPVVATTSRLLSTGVDVQDLKYVVLFRPVGSPVEFKQIIGRGTRLYPDKGKASFEIIDFVGATSHFADPDFDGYPVHAIDDDGEDGGAEDVGGHGSVADPPAAGPGEAEPMPTGEVAEPVPGFAPGNPGDADDDADDRPGRLRYVVDEGSFFVVAEAVQIPDTSTGELVLTEYGEFVAGQIKRLATSPADLAQRWSRTPGRSEVLAELAGTGVDVAELVPSGEHDVDLLDVLLQVAWNVPARTRAERARRALENHRSEMEARSELARAVLAALLDRYAAEGIDEVTSPEVSLVPPLSTLGSPRQLADELGPGGLHGAVDDVQQWLYSTDRGA